jgi:phosphate-selective porin OprO and OprP
MWQSRHEANPFRFLHKQSNAATLLITTKEVVFQNCDIHRFWRGCRSKQTISVAYQLKGDIMRGLSKTSRFLLAGASAIGLMTLGLPAANAQDLKAIQSQIDNLQTTIKDLQKQVQDAKAQAAAAKTAAAEAGKKDDLDLKVTWKGSPQFSSADGKKYSFKVRGRIDADYNNIDQDTAITKAPDVSGTALRRARLGVEGVLLYDLKYILEVDFAENAVSIKDAYIEYAGLKVGDAPLGIRLGNFKTPNSLEEMTSGNYLTFMERAAFVEAFGLDRQIGAGLIYNQEHYTLAAGIFGAGPQPTPLFNPGYGFPAFFGEETLAFAARGTFAPINREVNGVNQVLHFGASVRTRQSGDGEPFYQYQARAADLFLANRFVNTNRIGDSDLFWGVEAAGVWGPLSVQGEYAQLEVDLPSGATIRNTSTAAANGIPTPSSDFIVDPAVTRPNPFLGIPNPTFYGWYVDASYFLTGETRPYKDGIFQRVKVKNPVTWSKGSGWGAWQIAARYDVINLSDNAFNNASGVSGFTGGCTNTTVGLNTNTGNFPARIAQCGEQETWLVGVNWYLNDYVKLMFNYTQSELSGYPVTLNLPAEQTTYPAGSDVKGFDGATIRGFGMRAHVDW